MSPFIVHTDTSGPTKRVNYFNVASISKATYCESDGTLQITVSVPGEVRNFEPVILHDEEAQHALKLIREYP